MLRGFRLALLSLLGFAIPIACGLLLAPKLFRFTNTAPSDRVGPSGYPWAMSALDRPDAHQPDDPSVPQDALSGIRSVASDRQLDPQQGGYFVASFVVTMTSPPRTGKRQKFLWKYGGEKGTNPGWAIALRRFSTSIRPEVYWQGNDGKGGWYLFDRVRLRYGHWFALTFVARPGEFLSMYAQEVGPVDSVEIRPVAASDGDDAIGSDNPRFLGGYGLQGVTIDASPEVLSLAPRVFDSGDFRGAVRSMLIAAPQRLPKNRERFLELIRGGPDEIAPRFAESELGLWVRDDGVDHTAKSRPIVSERGAADRSAPPIEAHTAPSHS